MSERHHNLPKLFPRVPYVARTITIRVTNTGATYDADAAVLDHEGHGVNLHFPNQTSEIAAVLGMLRILHDRETGS